MKNSKSAIPFSFFPLPINTLEGGVFLQKKLEILLKIKKMHSVAVKIRFQSAFWLHLFVISGGIVNELAVLGEA